jgi:hypothetical protein
MGTRGAVRRAAQVALAASMTLAVAACTGRGGGYLPPGPSASDTAPGTVFTGQAQFGFAFSCEDKGGINPSTGQLRIQLQYSDRGTSPMVGAPFSLHGTVDTIDPVMESAFCIGKNPAPGGKLIFLGRYRLTSAPPGSPPGCSTLKTSSVPSCRFEVIVRDNDSNLAPSKGDFFSIKLSSASEVTSLLDPLTVFYARAGVLAGGNLTVD